jgi:hypothetical protein
MPCYRCGTRQVDPDRGESPWKRGVREERQVLVCPGCQTTFDWMADLDHCAVCASVRLVRRLGEVECRDCGAVRQPASTPLPGHLARLVPGARTGDDVAPTTFTSPNGVDGAKLDAEAQAIEGLSREVEQALARVLGRTAGSAASQ